MHFSFRRNEKSNRYLQSRKRRVPYSSIFCFSVAGGAAPADVDKIEKALVGTRTEAEKSAMASFLKETDTKKTRKTEGLPHRHRGLSSRSILIL